MNHTAKFSKMFLVLLVVISLLFISTPAPVEAGSPTYPNDFIILVTTDGSYTIPTYNKTYSPANGYDYNYNVDCTNDGTFEATAQTGDYTCSYGGGGSYTIRISDNVGDQTGFPAFFNYKQSSTEKAKLYEIKQWGALKWQMFSYAFQSANNLSLTATDSPDLSGVTSMANMFYGTHLTTPNMSGWDTSNVTSMGGMFVYSTNFNGNVSTWDVSNVTDMTAMFQGTKFNGDISGWNTTSLVKTNWMFSGDSVFNQDISGWDTPKLQETRSMFQNAAAFNQDISPWDTSSVTTMQDMFSGATSFNQNLGAWNVASLTNATSMLSGVTLSTANYDGLLNGWGVQSVHSSVPFDAGSSKYCSGLAGRGTLTGSKTWTISDGGISATCPGTFSKSAPSNSATKTSNTPSLSWASSTNASSYEVCIDTSDNNTCNTSWASAGALQTYTPSALNFNTTYYWQVRSVNSTGYRESNELSWYNFTTASNPADDFVITVDAQTYNDYVIPTLGTATYNYNVDCNNDGTIDYTARTGDTTCSYLTHGIYTIRILDNAGDHTGFPVFFNPKTDDAGMEDQLLSIQQWGKMKWTTFEYAFSAATKLSITATDSPDLSGVTSMSNMFHGAGLTTEDLSAWDTSHVTHTGGMFAYAANFNGDVSGWNVSNVTNMSAMFQGTPFNGDISAWNVAKVTHFGWMFNGNSAFNGDVSAWTTTAATSMNSMFYHAAAFDQDLSGWDTSNVTTFESMFDGATSFDQDLSAWDVTSLTDASVMFNGVTLSTANYDKLLNSWAAQTVKDNVTLTGGGSKYCDGALSRGILTGTPAWSITDGGIDSGCPTDFAKSYPADEAVSVSVSPTLTWGLSTNATKYYYCIDTVDNDSCDATWGLGGAGFKAISGLSVDTTYYWQVRGAATIGTTYADSNAWHSFTTRGAAANDFLITVNTGSSKNFTIPTSGTGYDYNVDCDNDGVSEAVGATGDTTCTYAAAGSYTIRIMDNSGADTGFPAFAFSESSEQDELTGVTQWGSLKWKTFSSAFLDAANLTITASDAPDLSGVTDLSNAFNGTGLTNEDLSGWDTSTITKMSGTFANTPNMVIDLSGWDVSSVENFAGMFMNAPSFNEDLSMWVMSSATNLDMMFKDAISFDQNLKDWDITNVNTAQYFLDGGTLSPSNYDALLIGWDAQTPVDGTTFNGGNSKYCFGADARADLEDSKNWVITDGGEDCAEHSGDLVFKVDSGSSTDFTVPTTGTGYSYSVDCNYDGNMEAVAQTGSYTCTYDTAGIYKIRIVAANAGEGFPRFYLNGNSEKDELLSVEKWGNIQWASFASAFKGATNLEINATDTPDLSGVTDMSGAFADTGLASPDLSSWNTSNVTKMSSMFAGAADFNTALNAWNTSKVTDMSAMFSGASSFDQDLSDWNVSKVVDMSEMFMNATSFNQDLTSWSVLKVSDFTSTFEGASGFDQDLSAWDVTSVVSADRMFNGIALSTVNYDSLLTGWNARSLRSNVVFDGGNSTYCNAAVDRANMVALAVNGGDVWTISDGGLDCSQTYPVLDMGMYSVPTNGARVTEVLTELTVSFSQDVLSGAVDGSAEDVNNYILVEAGANHLFDTESCSAGYQSDDVLIPVNSVSYVSSSNYLAHLSVNNGAGLPSGSYRLLVCGTTSIKSPTGFKIYNGLEDGVLEFQVALSRKAEMNLPKTGFSHGKETQLSMQPLDKSYAPMNITLRIPKLKLEMPIVGVPQMVDTWDISWLGASAGWLNGTSFPTWAGNAVLTGHVWGADNKAGPFARIKDLAVGDVIELLAFDRVYTYTIRSSEAFMNWDDPSRITPHKDSSWVTLLTCENYNETRDAYLQYRSVQAELTSVK